MKLIVQARNGKLDKAEQRIIEPGGRQEETTENTSQCDKNTKNMTEGFRDMKGGLGNYAITNSSRRQVTMGERQDVYQSQF